MFEREKIDRLQMHKRALIIESDLNRLVLRNEWQHVRASTAWVSDTAQICRQFSPWLLLAAPLAGILTARAARSAEGGILNRLLSAVKWLQPLWSIWQSYAGAAAQAHPKKPAAS